MNALKRKAKAGVTLVELLVVMLIVAILAVGLLPMFKEYICKAQYSADAIPVIGDLRTKIGLYWYDNSKLPKNPGEGLVSSWELVEDEKGEAYKPAAYNISSAPIAVFGDADDPTKMTSCGKTETIEKPTDHFGDSTKLSLNFENLKGKKSRPIDFVYYNIPCKTGDDGQISKTDYAYVVGCFGSGDGLAAGTGYAVCEINLPSRERKYVGTFERYKMQKNTEDGEGASTAPYLYLSDATTYNDGTKGVSGWYVYCPLEITAGEADVSNDDGRPAIITSMENNGWKFTE